jgi:alpha(1,3/1,4) fucosyltransferase
LETEVLVLVTGVNSGVRADGEEPEGFAKFLSLRDLIGMKPFQNPTRLICIDYAPNVSRKIRKSGFQRENCTLIRMEPSVVLPANFSKTRSRQFGKMLTLGGQLSKDSVSLGWPLVWPSRNKFEEIYSANRYEKAVLINGNKLSLIKGELYSLRRKSIKSITNLDLFGTSWDSNKYSRLKILIRNFIFALISFRLPRFSGVKLWFQNYPQSKGEVDNKLTTMSSYKYALVIENSAEYMSEKLFDAFFAGCIPIYVGPNVEDYGIPKNIVVQAEPNLKSIKQALETAKEMNFENFQRDLRKFLSDEKTIEKWSHENVYARMLEIILG